MKNSLIKRIESSLFTKILLLYASAFLILLLMLIIVYSDLSHNALSILLGGLPVSIPAIQRAAAFIFVGLVFLALYVLIIKLLKPLCLLICAFDEVNSGNLDYHLSTDRKDEMGKLIYSFKDLISWIKEMLYSRDHLLMDVSHELISPLIRARSELESVSDEEIRRAINNDLNEVETMIAEMFETERLKCRYGSIKKEKINLVNLLKEISVSFNNQKPGIKIIDFPENLPIVGDRERIKILFCNIFNNAIKYSDPEGYSIEVSHRKKEDEITIEVQDFGAGIPEQDLPYACEPFYKIKGSGRNRNEDYGLGMSICKKIIEAHGGGLEITSKENVGTSVFIRFIKA